ncbi:hypothetical protein SteCoe_10661 [Stentor coeruleus]|uniref:GST N-terminal domain-containing protein n=1 Tax=Stentor coeruleus TaxID=5963 RepID=A0A1R2CF36_9CILI|nr:hypothetical protein SteCoe_10661 [Stentor coeruleus]
MESVVIYADYLSQPCRAVLIFCEIAKISYKFHEVRVIKKQTLRDEYAKVSPSRTVPTMIHGDLILYESHAIIIYLIEKFKLKDNWYPNDIIKRALVNNYLHWHHMNLRLGCGWYVFNRWAGPMFYGGILKDLDVICNERREDAFQVLERILEKHKFVGRTDEVSVADIVCYCEIVQMLMVDIDLKGYPQLQIWFDGIGRIPEVQKVHKTFFRLLPRLKL